MGYRTVVKRVAVARCSTVAYLVVEWTLSPLDEDSSHCDDSSRSFRPTLSDSDIPIGSGDTADDRVEPSTGVAHSTLKSAVLAVTAVLGQLLWVVESSPSSGCVPIAWFQKDILACTRKGIVRRGGCD